MFLRVFYDTHRMPSGVILLHLSLDKYALTLMDAICDDNEMAQCCFIQSNRSTKPPLERALIEDIYYGNKYPIYII